jgi:hypothetical protein
LPISVSACVPCSSNNATSPSGVPTPMKPPNITLMPS